MPEEKTRNATYRDVCSGMTGHAEVVLVVFDPGKISYATLLRVFWESHDPTQGMRQGNDRGTQYRSVIHAGNDDQLAQARPSKTDYQTKLRSAGYGAITTEICDAPEFFLRRRLPSAVSGEKPEWLLRNQWHRG